MRPLGDASVVFDPLTWETHILTPELSFVAEFARELAEQGKPGASELRIALAHEADGVEGDFDALVGALVAIGVVDP